MSESELRADTCFACGYDLRATPPQGACPECGLARSRTAELTRDFEAHGTVGHVRLAAWFLLATFAMIVLLFAAAGGILLVGNPYVDENLVFTMITGWTIMTVAAATVAATAMTRPRDAVGGSGRRLLGVVAWLLPTLVVAAWTISFLTIVPDPAVMQIAVPIVLFLLALSAMLLPPLTILQIARRARYWPRWRSVGTTAKVLGIVQLSATGVALVPPMAMLIAVESFGWSPYEDAGGGYNNAVNLMVAKPFTAAVEWSTRIGGAIYTLSLVVMIVVLGLVLIGARVASRALRPSGWGPPTPAGTADRGESGATA